MQCIRLLVRRALRRRVVGPRTHVAPKAADAPADSPSSISHESYQGYHTPLASSMFLPDDDYDSSLVRGTLTVRNPGPSDYDPSPRSSEEGEPPLLTVRNPGPSDYPASQRSEEEDFSDYPSSQRNCEFDDDSDEGSEPEPFGDRAPSRLGFYPFDDRNKKTRSLSTIFEDDQSSSDECQCCSWIIIERPSFAQRQTRMMMTPADSFLYAGIPLQRDSIPFGILLAGL